MIILSSISDALQVVSTAAATVNVHVSWVDNAPTAVTPGRTNTAISTATTATVVAAPASGAQRTLQSLHVVNTHATVSTVITVQHTDGTTIVRLLKTTLFPGNALQMTDQGGFAAL